MTKTVLILGPTGRFGRNAAEAFWNAGWCVKLFDRSRDDLLAASRGAEVIVFGWNPAYPKWQNDVPALTERVIAAAEASGATVLLPGNVYVFGDSAPAALGPDVPHAATNPLGRVRVDMEARLRSSGAQVIVLRAGDFLDTEASGNWFDLQMAPGLRKGVLTYPGAPDVPHAWAFLPDMARAAVALAERRASLPRFSDIAFPGYTLSGDQMASLLSHTLSRPVRVKQMNWWPLQVLQPVWPMARHLLEMRYLWNKPHWLASDSFIKALPGFVATEAVDALSQAVAPVLARSVKEATGRPKPDHGDQSQAERAPRRAHPAQRPGQEAHS